MGRSLVVYDNFEGGEFGAKDAWKTPQNTFTAINMLVNYKGELMVRPGVADRTPAGVVAGTVQGFGGVGVPTADAWYVQGNTVRVFDILAGNNLDTASGTLSGTPTSPVSSVVMTNQTYLTALGLTGSYVLNTVPATPTLTALTGAPGARCITFYGAKVVLGDIEGSLDNRLRFSADLDPNSWPSGNFIDIGDNWGIRAMSPQRQHLIIAKQTGFYNLTGVPGVNHVIRKISNAPGPLKGLDMYVSPDDIAYFWPIGDGIAPGIYNGSQARILSHLSNHITLSASGDTIPATTGVQRVDQRFIGGAFFCSTQNKGILQRDGKWTYHTFGVNTSGFVAQDSGRVLICDGGAPGVAPKFYIWNHWADTPGIVGGDQMMPGDASTTALNGSVTFPEWWAPNGAEVRVRSVIVDFRSWNNGAANTLHFDLKATVLRRYDGDGFTDSTTVSWDDAPSGSSASGTVRRRVYGFGEQGIGNGFQLAFSNCRGMAIQRVEVVLDTAPVRV
jgi:hypothetical protein